MCEKRFLREERIGSSDDVVDEALSKAFPCKLVTDFLFWLTAAVSETTNFRPVLDGVRTFRGPMSAPPLRPGRLHGPLQLRVSTLSGGSHRQRRFCWESTGPKGRLVADLRVDPVQDANGFTHQTHVTYPVGLLMHHISPV